MANIVVSPLYFVKEREEVYPIFKKASQLCKLSFEKNMIDIHEFVLFENDGQEFNTCVDMFFDIFKKTYNLWREGHNIFFTDIDALCIRPTLVYGLFENFICFADSVKLYGSQKTNDRFADEFPMYFFTGSRYFPKDIPEDIWYIGFELWKNRLSFKWPALSFKWPAQNLIEYWDFEQYVYNKMFYAQPNMIREYKDLWQYNCSHRKPEAKDAFIISFWASRKNGMESMKQMFKYKEYYK